MTNIHQAQTSLLMGGFAAILLCGLHHVQVFLYFKSYAADSTIIKTIVSLVCLMDSIHTSLIVAALYNYQVTNYINPERMQWITWSLSLTVGCTATVAAIVNGFYGQKILNLSRSLHEAFLVPPPPLHTGTRPSVTDSSLSTSDSPIDSVGPPTLTTKDCVRARRSYHSARKASFPLASDTDAPPRQWILCGVVVLLALARLAMGLGVTVEMIRFPLLTAFNERFNWGITANLALAAALDALIPSFIAYTFYTTPCNQNTLGKTFKVYVFETGCLPSLITFLTLALWLAMPETLTFLGIYFTLSKCYAIAFVATLNTREIQEHGLEMNILMTADMGLAVLHPEEFMNPANRGGVPSESFSFGNLPPRRTPGERRLSAFEGHVASGGPAPHTSNGPSPLQVDTCNLV